MTAPTQPQCAAGAPRRIVWLEDGPHIATEPVASTNCVIDEKGRVAHRDSCMTSKAIRRATPDEIEEWRVRR